MDGPDEGRFLRVLSADEREAGYLAFLKKHPAVSAHFKRFFSGLANNNDDKRRGVEARLANALHKYLQEHWANLKHNWLEHAEKEARRLYEADTAQFFHDFLVANPTAQETIHDIAASFTRSDGSTTATEELEEYIKTHLERRFVSIEGSWESYAKQIARRQAPKLRNRRKKVDGRGEAGREPESPKADRPDEAAAQQDYLIRLKQEIRKLPPKQREAIRQYLADDGRLTEDGAVALGIKLRAYQIRFQQAVEMLGTRLGVHAWVQPPPAADAARDATVRRARR